MVPFRRFTTTESAIEGICLALLLRSSPISIAAIAALANLTSRADLFHTDLLC